MNAQPPDYETYAQFAARISVSKRFLQQLCAEGVIPTIKLGRRGVRIPVQRALELLRKLET